jgi:hypothetical protein
MGIYLIAPNHIRCFSNHRRPRSCSLSSISAGMALLNWWRHRAPQVRVAVRYRKRTLPISSGQPNTSSPRLSQYLIDTWEFELLPMPRCQDGSYELSLVLLKQTGSSILGSDAMELQPFNCWSSPQRLRLVAKSPHSPARSAVSCGTPFRLDCDDLRAGNKIMILASREILTFYL